MHDPDNTLDAKSASGIFALALMLILQPKEGLVIEYEERKVIIWKEESGGIIVVDGDENDHISNLEHGQLLWAADTQEEADARNDLESFGIPVNPNNPPEIH